MKKPSHLKFSGFEDLSYVTENVTWAVVVENCISRARDHGWGGKSSYITFYRCFKTIFIFKYNYIFYIST